jgi:PAS domain S-box-containing protein
LDNEKTLKNDEFSNQPINVIYKAAFDNSFDAITIYTEDGTFVNCNERAIEMFGLKDKKSFSSIKPAELSPDFQPDGRNSEIAAREYVSEILKTGKFLKFEWQHKRINGELFPCRVILTSYRLNNQLVRQATIHDISNEKKREITEKHLKDVLAAIRNVNQLITKENDAKNLIQEACRLLTEDVQYYGVWIAILKSGKVVDCTCSGSNEQFQNLKKQLADNNYPDCMQKMLNSQDIIIIREPGKRCNNCPLANHSKGRVGFSYHLKYNDIVYGIIAVSVPAEYADLPEEQELFKEVADDLGFALHKIELNKIHEETALKIQEHERQLSSVIGNLPGFVYRCKNDKDWTMLYVSEQCIEITEYQSSDFLNNSVIAFNDIILPEFQENLYYLWEKAIQKRTDFVSEYKIKTKSGNIKWVWERGKGIFNSKGELKFLEGYIEDITDEKLISNELIKAKERYEKQRNSIAKLAINEAIINGNIEKTVQLITETAANTVSVSQASLWFLKNNHNELHCIDLYDSSTKQHSFGKTIDLSNFPNYFHALKNDRQLAISDAQNDDKTKGLSASYLIPEGIFSLLDTSIWNDDVVGVLCLEQKNKMRIWQADERNYCRILTTIFMQTVSISEKIKAEEELKKSEVKFRSLVQHSTDIIALYSPDGTVLYKSPGMKSILGFEPEEVIGRNVLELVHPEDKEMALELFAHLSSISNAEHVNFEIRALHKDGTYRWMEATITNKLSEPTVMAYIGNYRDITASKEAREKIERSLKEKTILIKEIHHRVKNNLQIISSMINLQIANMACEPDQELMLDVRNRIRAIALVHEKVYQSSSLDRINADGYIQAMARQLLLTFSSSGKKIELDIKVENVMFTVDEAVPCALIINELITNSFKYAFMGREKGTIKIYFFHDGSKYRLSIEDDGIGFQKKVNLQNPESLGLRIVTGLVAQLDGTIELKSDKGTRFQITF